MVWLIGDDVAQDPNDLILSEQEAKPIYLKRKLPSTKLQESKTQKAMFIIGEGRHQGPSVLRTVQCKYL